MSEITASGNVFNTPEEIRCRDCAVLVEDKKKRWICDECGKDIHKIDDGECPEGCRMA